MTNEQQNLWRRIAAFQFDRPDAALPFSRRLARENGWSPTYTRRVLDEYRRFLFLAVAAGHPVSPSEDVDAAWHLHLLYTESYWTDLCQDTLGRPVHHGPTRGGAAESAKLEDWYARTLASYRRLFGEEAPPDLWPATPRRKSAVPPQRAADGSYWTLRLPKRTAAPLALAIAALLLAGAAGSETAGLVLVGVIALGLVLLVAGAMNGLSSQDRRRRTPSGGGSGNGGGSHFDSAGVFHYGGSDDRPGHHGGHDGEGSADGGDSGSGDSGGGDSGCGSSGCGGGCGGGGGD